MIGIKYTEMMGENVLPRLKYCGKEVKVLQLAKIINPQFAELDDYSMVLDYTFIDARESFKLGKYSMITWQCVIEGWAHINIGDRCFLGPGTKLLGSTYEFNGYYTAEHLPDGAHRTRFGDINICDDAYLGANCVVMPGVTIGEGAVVGSCAFINKDLDPWGIYVGCPAKKIGDRTKPTPECKAIIDKMDWTKHF